MKSEAGIQTAVLSRFWFEPENYHILSKSSTKGCFFFTRESVKGAIFFWITNGFPYLCTLKKHPFRINP